MAYRCHAGFGNVVSNAELVSLLIAITGSSSSAANGSVTVGDGRFGGNTVHDPILFAFSSSAQTWISGFAYKMPSSLPGSDQTFFELRDGATTQVDLRLTSTGAIKATRNGTSLGTSAFTMSPSTWYYLEVKIVVDNSVGSVEVRVGQSTKLNLTSQDTQETANATADRIRYLLNNVGIIGDLYILDGGGASLNDFQGESRMLLMVPNASGNYTQWTVSGATNNFQAVDETDPNDDTDYNSTSTTGNKDTFGFTNLPTSGAVVCATTALYSRRDDAGPRQIRELCRSGGSDFSGVTQTIQSTYAFYAEARLVDPNTGSTWTQGNLESAEFGYELVT